MIHANAAFSWGEVALPAVQAGMVTLPAVQAGPVALPAVQFGAPVAGSANFSWGGPSGAERSLPQDFHFRADQQDFHRGAEQSDGSLMRDFAADQAPEAAPDVGGQQHADFSWGM